VFDISAKNETLRTPTARATFHVSETTPVLIREGNIPKGDPLQGARVAALQAAKNTSQIIPFCHPLPIEYVSIEFEVGIDRIISTVMVKATYKTGVDVEAVTAAVVVALTLYDMLKMVDDRLRIEEIILLSKTGGKGTWRETYAVSPRAAEVVLLDSVAAGKKKDAGGQAIVERLCAEQVEVLDYRILPDDPESVCKSGALTTLPQWN
jgi:molybdenum cofactor biosynthesis protein MoaC